MRYAVVSDLHANLQAWQTVLADLAGRNIDTVICLGDIVGYGPRPAEVLSSAYQNIDYFVLGNHDAVIGGCLDEECFNDDARQMIRWTAGALDTKATAFFQELPVMVAGNGFRCAHGSADPAEPFDYVVDETSARDCVRCCDEPLIFVGHSHEPQLCYFNRRDKFRQVAPVDFVIETGKRYIVNVGSVGMPRDGDFRSSYCIFDDEDMSVSFLRVPYDVDAFRRDVNTLIPRSRQSKVLLAAFDEQRRGPLREQVDFAPARGSLNTSAPREQQLTLWRSRARWWRWAAAALLVICLASLGLAWAGRESGSPQLVESARQTALQLHAAPRGEPVNLLPRSTWSGDVNEAPPGYSLRFTAAERQTVSFRGDREMVVRLAESAGEVTVTFPDLNLGTVRKVQVLLIFQADNYQGELPVLHIDLLSGGGKIRRNYDTKTAVKTHAGSYRIQRTTRKLPRESRAIRLRLRCRGQGTLRFKTCRVTPRSH